MISVWQLCFALAAFVRSMLDVGFINGRGHVHFYAHATTDRIRLYVTNAYSLASHRLKPAFSIPISVLMRNWISAAPVFSGSAGIAAFKSSLSTQSAASFKERRSEDSYA
jgi:hypothetical protein